MGGQDHRSQDEDLTLHSRIHIEDIPVSRISANVMRQITNKAEQGANRNRKFRTRKGALAATIAILMLFISVTAYAANEYLQLRDQKGRVIVQTSNNQLPSISKCGNLLDKYRREARKSIKAGTNQGVAFYVKGSEKVCGQILLGFEYGYDYGIQSSDASLSNAFFQAMSEYLKPAPNIKPKYLPNGYLYLNGSFAPKSIAADQTEYQKLVQQLSAKAKESGDGTVLFTEPISWNEADSAMISYIDDTDLKLITILATRMNGQEVDMNIPKNTESQKIVVNKQEVIYIGPNMEFSNKAIWYDSHTDILVSTWDDANSGISREEFLKMVHSILN